MGGKAAEKLPADEQELLDEQPTSRTTSQIISRQVVETGPDGQQAVRYVTEEVVSSLPPFLYVTAISSSQRKALLTEAFANAKSQAAELAEAAGGKLGAIKNISGEVSNSKPCVRFIDASPPTSSPFLPSPNENSSEAIAADPAGLKFYAKVHALFRLE